MVKSSTFCFQFFANGRENFFVYGQGKIRRSNGRSRVPACGRGEHRHSGRTPAHFPVLRSDEPEMLRERTWAGGLGLSQRTAQGARAVGPGRDSADKSELSPHL